MLLPATGNGGIMFSGRCPSIRLLTPFCVMQSLHLVEAFQLNSPQIEIAKKGFQASEVKGQCHDQKN